jgi:hypothetical protein
MYTVYGAGELPPGFEHLETLRSSQPYTSQSLRSPTFLFILFYFYFIRAPRIPEFVAALYLPVPQVAYISLIHDTCNIYT